MANNFFGKILASLGNIFGIKDLEKKKSEEALEKFKGKKVYGHTSNANFFGRQSLGVAQIRGNGVLVLSEEVLYFKMWALDKELSIPLASITGVETPKIFLGRTKMRPLLKVNFKNKDGNDDAAAWLLKNLPHWQSAIEKIAAKNKN